MLFQLLAFVGVSAVVICTPGPDTALTVRNTLAGGRRSGIATAFGVGAGLCVWTLAASPERVAVHTDVMMLARLSRALARAVSLVA